MNDTFTFAEYCNIGRGSCGRPASALASIQCPHCDLMLTELICEGHYELFVQRLVTCATCQSIGVSARVRVGEPVRV